MKPLIFLLLFVCTFVVGYQEIFSRSVESCLLYRDVTRDYRVSVYEFTTQAIKDVGPRSLYHFIFSPLSVWIVLAAMAEGADPYTQKHLFGLLRLPNDPCARLRYYQLATSRYIPGNDVSVLSTRSLVVNHGLAVNPYWHNFVSKNRLIDLASTPLQYDPQGSLNAIRLLSSATLANIDLSGNSLLVDTLDFNGLWSTAFSDAVIQRSPFYDPYGQKIGAIDLMRVSRRARIAFVSSINAKILELSIGVDDRYRMLFALILDTTDIDTIVSTIKSTIIDEFLGKSRESYVPVEIAIPRLTMTSEVNVRSILVNLGVRSLWTDPAVTRYLIFLYLYIEN